MAFRFPKLITVLFLMAISSGSLCFAMGDGQAAPPIDQNQDQNVCSRFLKEHLNAIQSQISPGFLIQSAADAFLIYELVVQSRNLAEATPQFEALSQSCLNELSQMSCVGMDQLTCRYLSELQEWVQNRYETSGFYYNWNMKIIVGAVTTFSEIAQAFLSLPNFLSLDYSQIPVFSLISGVRAISNPFPASVPVSYLAQVPQSVITQLASLTRDNTQVLVAATAAAGIRSYRVVHQYVVNKRQVRQEDNE